MTINYGGAGDNAPPFFESLREQPTIPFPLSAVATSTGVTRRPCILVGWSLRESTGGATAAVRLIDGGDATGQNVAAISLASGGSDHEGIGPDGPLCNQGLFLQIVSGSVEGSLWIKV